MISACLVVYLWAWLGAAQFSLDDELPDELFPTSFSSVSTPLHTTIAPVSKVMEKFMEKVLQFQKSNDDLILKRNESYRLRDESKEKIDSCFGASCREFSRSLYDAQVASILSLTKEIIEGIRQFQRDCNLSSSVSEVKDCEHKTGLLLQEERDSLEEMVIVRSHDSIVRIAVGLASFSLGLIYSIGVLIFTILKWKFHMDWKLIATCLGVAFICMARIAYGSVVTVFFF